VLIRSRETGTGGLVDALTANFHHATHTPVEEAHAFARLLEAGLTRCGLRERLQVSRELVRDRLEILQLPEDLHALVDNGTIPLGAVRTPAGLAKLHPDLPACAVRRVTREPTESWRRRPTWPDVIADPIGAITTQYQDEAPDLPAGVFDAHASYPISAFTLDERGEKNLAALADAERAEQRDRDRELTVRAVEQLRTSAGWQAGCASGPAPVCAVTASISRGPVSPTTVARCRLSMTCRRRYSRGRVQVLGRELSSGANTDTQAFPPRWSGMRV
jgi:hypothetical protein